jgi:hypothetical protein
MKGPRGDMCACAVDDSRLRIVYAPPHCVAALLVRQGSGRCASGEIVRIPVVFGRAQPFSLEWHFTLQRVRRASSAPQISTIHRIGGKSIGNPFNATGSILAMTTVRRGKGT